MTAALIPATTDLMVLCGGRGTRLGSLTDQTPKPLLPVGDRPFLLHLLLRMKREGFTRVILSAHYRAEQFQRFLSTYGDLVPDVQLVVEPEPLGTGGALRYAMEQVRSSVFVVLNGDSWVWQPVASVLAEHQRVQRACTIVAVQASHVTGRALNKGRLQIGANDRLEDVTTQETVTDGWVNAGIYVLDRAMVASWPKGSYSLEATLPTLVKGYHAGVFRSQGRLLDIGTPECYDWAGRLFQAAESLVPTGSEHPSH